VVLPVTNNEARVQPLRKVVCDVSVSVASVLISG
jgi:hypothetical protein